MKHIWLLHGIKCFPRIESPLEGERRNFIRDLNISAYEYHVHYGINKRAKWTPPDLLVDTYPRKFPLARYLFPRYEVVGINL